jgi:LEA14-like dessication related protein
MALRTLAAALAVLVLSACSFTHFEKPSLEVVDIQLLKGDLLQQQLKVRMRVHNPNDRDLPVRGITCELELAGEAFAHGESQRDFVVPALGSAEFDVGVTANAASALLKLIGSGRKLDMIDYRLVGKVALASGMMRSIPFDQRGQFKLH